jgi:hypothetical protein
VVPQQQVATAPSAAAVPPAQNWTGWKIISSSNPLIHRQGKSVPC